MVMRNVDYGSDKDAVNRTSCGTQMAVYRHKKKLKDHVDVSGARTTETVVAFPLSQRALGYTFRGGRGPHGTTKETTPRQTAWPPESV